MKASIAIASCFLFVFALALSQEAPKPEAKSANSPRDADKQGTEQFPIFVKGDITTKASEKTEYDRKVEEKKQQTDVWIMRFTGLAAVFTFLLVIVTSVLAWFTYKLWGSTNKLVKETRDTATRQLRAYVGVIENEVISALDDEIIGRVSFKNTGRSPAHDLTSWICEGVFIKNEPSESFFAKGDDQSKGGVLVPGVTWTRNITISIHGLNMDHLEKESDAIWIWGGIDYKDSFGEPCSVSFRFWVGEKRLRLGPVGERMVWWPLIPHKNGNKATYGDKTQT